jgi:MoxR-like ATPase
MWYNDLQISCKLGVCAALRLHTLGRFLACQDWRMNHTSETNGGAHAPLNRDSIDKLQAARKSIIDQLSKVIVGQQDVINELLISIFSRGHCLLEGVPGLAKTLLISTLARTLSLSFSRIQFTPDLMPADITGTEVIEEQPGGGLQRRFMEGPLFANVILADEINRTPPKTQAALLEAMQERQVTVGRQRHALGDPFFVLATQNPIEQEGTYPLPEAQQDRFMFKVLVDYPSFNEELEVARRTTSKVTSEVQPVLSGHEIMLWHWSGKREWAPRVCRHLSSNR